MTNIDALITFLLLGINLLIAFTVISSNSKRRSNIYFFVFLIFLSLWKITLSVYLDVTDSSSLDFWGRLNFGVTTLIGVFVLFFANYFPDNSSYFKRNKINNIFIFLSIAIAVTTIFTGLVSEKEYINSEGEHATIFGPFYTFFIAHFIFCLILTLYILIRKYRKVRSIDKSQIKIVFISFILTIVFSLTTNVILPFTFGIFSLQSLGPLGTIFLTVGITYCILRFEFLDIRVLIGRLVYYGLMSFFVLLFYYFVYFLDIILYGTSVSLSAVISGLPSSVIFVVLFIYVNKLIRENVESKLINPGFDPREVLDTYSNRVNTQLDTEKISTEFINVVNRTLRPDALNLLSNISDKNRIHLNIDKELLSLVEEYWKLTKFRYIYDQTIFESIYSSSDIALVNKLVELMEKYRISIIHSLNSKDELLGLLIIGNRENKSNYNIIEIKHLNAITDLTSLALARAYLYQEVKTFNETLQQKVDSATIEIQEKNQKLQETLTFERDMLDILGHELRTPLGTARNAILLIQMMKNKGNLDDAKFDKELKIAVDNIRREVQLLETILASTKIDNNRLELDISEVDLKEIIESSVDSQQEESNKKKLNLINDTPNISFNSLSDKLRIQQVVDNLLNNAVKYTREGSINVGVLDEGTHLKVYIRDTGEGIPENEIPNLGKKFYRINTYLNPDSKPGDSKIVRPGGTGIGLYVVFQLVKAMRGEVFVKSTLGKGSEFSFTIPKAK